MINIVCGHNAIMPKPVYANLSSDVNNKPTINPQRVKNELKVT